MPKPGSKISLVNAIPCRISFEVEKEDNYSFLAISRGTSGWVILAKELPQERQHRVVQAIAPLAASNPLIDEKHPTWLHLRIWQQLCHSVIPLISISSMKQRTSAMGDVH